MITEIYPTKEPVLLEAKIQEVLPSSCEGKGKILAKRSIYLRCALMPLVL